MEIKLEDDFGSNYRLLDDIETRSREFLGGQVKIHEVDNNGDHWVKVVYEISETLIAINKEEITEALIRGFVVGFLEANRITCI